MLENQTLIMASQSNVYLTKLGVLPTDHPEKSAERKWGGGGGSV